MKIVTWNINSLNLRLERLLAWLASQRPDVVCLQETKCEDAKFPVAPLADAGYRAVFAGQKSYNGVAILAREGLRLRDTRHGVDAFEDPQRRAIATTVEGSAAPIHVICVYVPNGQAVGTDKYRYKLEWCRAAASHLHQAALAHIQLVVAGDFNIAPEDRDVHDPDLWREQVMCSTPEREAFGEFLGAGLVDSYRLFDQPPNTFSWWDYRMLAFPKNHGLRIDHILLSAPLASSCTACTIDRSARKGVKPSDHAPVVATLAL